MYSGGQGYITLNVFYGYDMTDTEYTYIYNSIKSTKIIEDECLLDVVLYTDHIYRTPAVIRE